MCLCVGSPFCSLGSPVNISYCNSISLLLKTSCYLFSKMDVSLIQKMCKSLLSLKKHEHKHTYTWTLICHPWQVPDPATWTQAHVCNMNTSTRTQHEHKHTIMLLLVNDDVGPSPNLSKGWVCSMTSSIPPSVPSVPKREGKDYSKVWRRTLSYEN